MRTVTLAQLKRMARLYADERGGGPAPFIGEDELRDLINSAVADHYDLLVHAGGHERYETVDTSIATVDGTATIDLPDDFYELLSLHLAWGTNQLERVEALDSIDDRRDLVNHGVWARDSAKAFRRRGALIEFFPTPNAATDVELRYVATAPVLTAENDTFDGVNGWERMIEYRVAGEMLAIAGKSPSAMLALYETEREKIELLAHQSTASSPDRIRDVRYQNRGGRRRFGPVPAGST